LAYTISDAIAVARVHVDSWRTAYRGIVHDSHLENLSYDQKESWWRNEIGNERSFVFVAEASKQIVGFANGGRERSKNSEYTSEIGSIYILEEYRRK
jgi:hypothetical protein